MLIKNIMRMNQSKIIKGTFFFIAVLIFGGSNIFLKGLQQSKVIDNKPLTNSDSSLYNFDWYRTVGGLYEDDSRGVAVDNDNNVYVVGGQYISGTDQDIVIIKYDTSGTQQWVAYWGGSNYEFGYDLVIDDLNNLYIVGYTKSKGDINGDIVVLKYNSNGQELWNLTWGGSNYDVAAAIDKDSMYNFYITGTTCSFGDIDDDAVLVKFNSIWEEQWNVTWGGSNTEESGDVVVDSDDVIYISGRTDSIGSGGDAFLLKYNSAGNLQWQRTWGTSYAQIFSGIATDSSHNIYGVGMTFGHPASSGKGLVVKYDSAGTYQWERIWGVNGYYDNYMYKIIIDNKNDLYIAGLTYSYGISNNHDAILFNYDTSGNQLWYKTWATSLWDLTFNLCIDSLSNIYLVGNTKSYSVGGSDILLLKYSYTPQDIQIITPESKIYTVPMSGYYPATYGFEGDDMGKTPFDWTTDESGGQIEIIEALDGHEKVLQLRDNSASDYIVLNNSILKTSGTIEFWMRVAQKSTGMFTYIIGDYNYGIHFYVQENGYFTYWDGVGVRHDIEPYNANQWYHIKIEFDLIDWHLWIDQIRKDSDGFAFYGTPTIFKKVGFSSWIPGTGYLYIDAIGYSWDINYNIGDNLNEGLLLSFQTASPLDWMGYSLDYQPNRTIYGNTTIPMPSTGVHSIKIVGVDSLDQVHQSSLRVFSIDLTDVPPYDPHNNQVTIIMFIIIGVIAILGITLVTILIVNNMPRKPPLKSFYNSPVKMEEIHSKEPIKQNLQSNKRLNQCPYCLLWDELGGNYCAYCGGKLPEPVG